MTPPSETPSGPGWFDDPEDASQLRYFDGVVWSKHTESKAPRRAPEPAVDPQPPTDQPFAGGPYAPPGQQPPVGAPPVAPGQQPWSAQQPYGGPPQQPYGGLPHQPGQWPTAAHPQASWVSGPTTADGVPLASFAQRLGAFLLDWVIQAVLGAVLGGYFLFQAMRDYLSVASGLVADAEGGATPDTAALMDAAARIDLGQYALYTLVTIAVFVVYQFAFLTRGGQTPGKMLVGISVRAKDRPGPPSSATVLRRLSLPLALFLAQLVPLLSYVGIIGRGLDLLFPLWDPSRQALHDKAAGTVVVVGKQERPRA